jgi:hypothetical protein
MVFPVQNNVLTWPYLSLGIGVGVGIGFPVGAVSLPRLARTALFHGWCAAGLMSGMEPDLQD